MDGQPSMFDIDPKPVEVTLHPQIADHVVMEHPAHREHHQSLAPLQTMLHELMHLISPRCG
jgi:hypothetical protein